MQQPPSQSANPQNQGEHLHTNSPFVNNEGANNRRQGDSQNNENQDPNEQENEQENQLESQQNLKNKFELYPMNDLVKLQRSYQYSMNDRFLEEQEYMLPLNTGGGLLGRSRIYLEDKTNLLDLDKDKVIEGTKYLDQLKLDGIYVDDPQMHQKFTDINVQKLEERLVREKQTDFFKINGELKLQNDLLADEITRPSDLAFEQTDAYQTKVVNSILSDRLHSFKKRYYRLDIIVGKISLQNYQEYFTQEDKIAIQLKELYKEYERRTSLAMIPFYMERLKYMEQQQDEKMRNPQTPKQDIEFLKSNRDETQRKLDQEKREVQEKATQLYEKWKQIKEIRQNNGFASTNIKLKVHKDNYTGETYFNLIHEEPSGKKFDGSALPGSEIKRRNNAMKIKAYVRLVINSKPVAKTRQAFLKWPNYEIELMEQFQIHIFTMPSQIQLELYIGKQLVDLIDVEVPGKHVKALTSASSMVKEIQFSKVEYEKQKLSQKYQEQSTLPDGELTEAQKKKLEQEQKKKQLQDERARNNDTKGQLYFKAEWKGEGPEMPPMRSENIFKSEQVHKYRSQYSEEDQRKMIMRQLYIDVNDPRNEKIIRFIKETKNEFLIQMLSEDSKNPLSRLEPFRHKLMEHRHKDPQLQKMPIPLLEKEIIDISRNKFYLDQLESIFREQAYREFLEKRAQQEKDFKAEKQDERQLQLAEFLSFDAESIRRRQIFFDLIKQKQKEIKAGHQRAQTQYRSIVSEFQVLDARNPLIAIFNKLFISGRKLRPVVRKREAVSLDSCKESKIIVHVIKGYHVPVRSQVFKQITQLKQAQSSMNPFNRNMPGPTARTPQNFLQQNQQMMGASSGMEMGRQSMPNPNQMGSNNFQMGNTFQNNTMMMNTGFNPQLARTVGGDIDELNRRAMMNLKIKDYYKIARVETFVEVRIVYNEYYTEVKTTNIAEGDFPEWNEILNFKLLAENGKKFTKEELINSNTMIYVSLFDQQVTPYKEDDYNTAAIKMTIEYRYLGSFSVPLQTILYNPPKMEAMFKVNRPLALFNYLIIKDNIFLMDEEERVSQQQRTNEELNTYISLSISLDPVLEIPSENELEFYPGAESQTLLMACLEWKRKFKANKKFAHREIRCLGENVYGQSVLLCRYLTEQAPPLDVCDLENYKNDDFAIEKSARYVSLIPFLEDNKAFSEMPELYCTSQEFLDLGAGDYEEHAILLCNYFNYIDKIQNAAKIRSYLVLGKGTPEGKTAYVLRRDTETNNVELWNPIKGEAYYFGRREMVDKVGCLPVSKGYSMDIRINDPTCQLKSIGCIIGANNIWANVQNNEEPGLLNYDLDNTKVWQPIFNNSNFEKYFPNIEVHTVQPPIMYTEPQQNYEELAVRIQKYISQKFQDERINAVKMTTKWNVAVGDKLINILFHCEMFKLKSRQGATNSKLRSAARQNANEDLEVSKISEQIRKATEDDAHGKRAWGFPINVKFVTLELLWEEVKNTKLHAIMDRNAEFSLSVYVKSYSCNVLSVWLYLAAFTKQRINA